MPLMADGKSYGPVQDSQVLAVERGQKSVQTQEQHSLQLFEQTRNNIRSKGSQPRPVQSMVPAGSGRQSLLLELPPELRCPIYGFVAADRVALVNPKRPGSITDGSPLLGVSRAIRGEYLDVVSKTSKIVAVIEDLDFRHIVAFLNKLDKGTLHSRRSTGLRTAPSITIILLLPWDAEGILGVLKRAGQNLRRWLLWCNCSTKKAANVEFSYEIKIPPESIEWMPYMGLQDFKLHLLKRWPKPDGTHFFTELIKIITATDQADTDFLQWRWARFKDLGPLCDLDRPFPMPDWEELAKRHPCSAIYCGKRI